MRLIDVCASAIRTVAISPDSRLVAASAASTLIVLDWATGEVALHAWGEGLFGPGALDQVAFASDNRWAASGMAGGPLRLHQLGEGPRNPPPAGTLSFSGGVAVSPDGKLLVATQDGLPNRAILRRWALPGLQPVSGFDFWSPFRRLAFSPNGHYLAGIWPGEDHDRWPITAEFELRFATSGGLDCRYRPSEGLPCALIGFISFTRDSGTCVFGWEQEFHVLDTSTGTSRYLRRVDVRSRDGAFTGSGSHFGTVEETGLLKLWDAKTWQVVREYDWRCGPLTCLAFTADGSAGVCGTEDGRLVQFDVDE